MRKAYSLYIHYNYGEPISDELIEGIVSAMKEAAVLGTGFDPDWEHCYAGDEAESEELIFMASCFSAAPVHEAVLELSRKFPECSFCVKSIDKYLYDLELTYYRNGKFEHRSVTEEWYSDLW